MNIKEIEAYSKAIAPIIQKIIAKHIDDLRSEIMPLIEQLKAIEIPENGKDGANGVDGKNGIDGTSIVIEDLIPIIDEIIQGIQKPVDGKDGLDGKDGKDGISVSIEDLQPIIKSEIEKQFLTIQLPKDGLNGEPGRDALQLEILPEIDTEKSYPRGTYAKYNGGLWRSFELTHDMRGWECIVDGVASFEVQQAAENEREYKAIATLSSGIAVINDIYIPAMIYRGIWEPNEYQLGDNVTWGGSTWHCEATTSDKPGEAGSKGWRLSVKKGRDGKNGLNGKDAQGVVKI